jgi:hypothetical protein
MPIELRLSFLASQARETGPSVESEEYIMANSKPVKSSKKSPAPEGKEQAAAPAAKTKAANKKASVPSAPEIASANFSGIAIGHAAGDVWGLLSSGDPRTIAEIKKSVKAPGDVVVAAIGWLAREHKLEFVASGKTVKIGLR